MWSAHAFVPERGSSLFGVRDAAQEIKDAKQKEKAMKKMKSEFEVAFVNSPFLLHTPSCDFAN